MLERTINFAWAADFEVDFGKVKTVGRPFELAETQGRLGVAIGDEVAKTSSLATADATAELMDLGEAIILGVHNHHQGGVWDVDADFDDGSID